MQSLRLISVIVIVICLNITLGARNDTLVPGLVPLSWFLKVAPFFDLTKIPQISEKCREDFQEFLTAMEKLELWALKMHDASAKLPSGIFNGNVNQYGDYDQCLNVKSASDVKGKYCIAYVQPKSRNGTMKDLLKLVQSHEFFKSNFDDCGHRTPRFSHINWAVCIPSSCTHRDLELGIRQYLKEYSENSDIEISVKVDPEMCQVKKEMDISELDRTTIRVILLMVVMLFVCSLSTIYDLKTGQNEKNQWLVTFSLYKNMKDLVAIDDNPNDIKTVHGIRFVNAVVLMFTHKSMAVLFNPFINRTEMTRQMSNPFLLVYASSASLYTDIFLMLSGLLTTYTFFGRLQRGQKIRLWRELMERYFRIIPSVVFLILFCTYILPLLNSGPMWNLVVTSHSEICKKNWWRNMLFIQNWFGYNSICLTNTHHVGIDMQLFIFGTFLIMILWKWPKRGLQLIGALALLSTLARFYVTMVHELSIHIFFGISLQKIAEVADRMYIIPPFRFTVYALGMVLGYLLRKYKNHQPTRTQLGLGWTLTFLSFFITLVVSVRMNFPEYQYNKFHAALYAAFAPVTWSIFSAWIIYAGEKGSNNQIVQLFKWRIQRVFTKLSYAIYLTQFPVFFYNVGRVRNAEYFEFIKVMSNFEEFASILICSIILNVFVEAPFNNLRKLMFDRKPLAIAKKID